MVMNFWEAQRKAKSKTALYLFVFILLTIAGAFLAEVAMRVFAGDNYSGDDYSTNFPYVGLAFLGITFLVAGFNYMSYLQAGGSYVAESMNARLIDSNTRNPKERQLLNIVEEMALATSLPVPPVYVLDAQEINAFAAGTNPTNAAITVTRGTLNQLSRDELQGVLAHEFGHIYNGDMKIGMRVAAMIMGFFIASYIGLRLLNFSSYGGESRNGEDRRGGGNVTVIIALILLVIGAVTWFFGSILQAMVSRQREYLADACSVQFTRNPAGIVGALKKIAASINISDMPKSGKPYSHLYFNEHASFWEQLFATHPPLEERIEAIEGGEYKNIVDLPEPLPPR